MYKKEDLESDIPRIKRKAQDYFKGLEESGLDHPEGDDVASQDSVEGSLASHTVDELKDMLRSAGKKVSGTKDELIERLK